MSKIKFTAIVNQGNIEVPQEYQEAIEQAESIEIIVDSRPSSQRGIIHHLLSNPIEIQDFKPLKIR